MMNKEYGGNIVKNVSLDNPGKLVLSSGLYEYYFLNIINEEVLKFDELAAFSLYVLDKERKTSIEVLENKLFLQKSDSIQVENSLVKLQVSGGGARFLIAGSEINSNKDTKVMSYQIHEKIYKVSKPWGYELWISGQHPCYAFKEIFIKAGTKTSLQFHHHKKETNVLFSGRAKLHYKSKPLSGKGNAGSKGISNVELESISSIDVMPGNIHRIQAVTDILLYEVSTPHLDDVVRLQDDNKRPDGRIKEEHSF